MLNFSKVTLVVFVSIFMFVYSASAKSTSKPAKKVVASKNVAKKSADKNARARFLTFEEFKKMKPEDQESYLELMRRFSSLTQSSHPSFVQFLWEKLTKNAEAQDSAYSEAIPNIDDLMAQQHGETIPDKVETPVLVCVPGAPGCDQPIAEKPIAIPTCQPGTTGCAAPSDSFQLRCFYGGFAVGKAETGKNSCSPVTGDICSASNPFNRSTRPKLSTLNKTVCALGPNAGKCDGGVGTISDTASKNMIVCNPTIYGMRETGGVAHVICVPNSKNASKKCEELVDETAEKYLARINNADHGAAWRELTQSMENSCRRYVTVTGPAGINENWSVNEASNDLIRKEIPDVVNPTDLQETCIAMLARWKAVPEIRRRYQQQSNGIQ